MAKKAKYFLQFWLKWADIHQICSFLLESSNWGHLRWYVLVIFEIFMFFQWFWAKLANFQKNVIFSKSRLGIFLGTERCWEAQNSRGDFQNFHFWGFLGQKCMKFGQNVQIWHIFSPKSPKNENFENPLCKSLDTTMNYFWCYFDKKNTQEWFWENIIFLKISQFCPKSLKKHEYFKNYQHTPS